LPRKLASTVGWRSSATNDLVGSATEAAALAGIGAVLGAEDPPEAIGTVVDEVVSFGCCVDKSRRGCGAAGSTARLLGAADLAVFV
jgi:hypothetical protein